MDDTTRDRLKTLVETIRSHRAGYSPDSQQSPFMAELHALIAEEQSKSAAKLERFTWWLVCLTSALIFIGVVQIVLMIRGH